MEYEKKKEKNTFCPKIYIVDAKGEILENLHAYTRVNGRNPANSQTRDFVELRIKSARDAANLGAMFRCDVRASLYTNDTNFALRNRSPS